jgi:hypothetical protein
VRLAAGAGVGRFAKVHFQFAATRTPQAAIRLLRAFEQKNFRLLVEAVKQRGDFVGQNHPPKFEFQTLNVESKFHCHAAGKK